MSRELVCSWSITRNSRTAKKGEEMLRNVHTNAEQVSQHRVLIRVLYAVCINEYGNELAEYKEAPQFLSDGQDYCCGESIWD